MTTPSGERSHDATAASSSNALESPPRTGPGATPTRAHAAQVGAPDALVGKVADLLRALGLAERAVVLVTSDHGPLDGTRPTCEGSAAHAGPMVAYARRARVDVTS